MEFKLNKPIEAYGENTKTLKLREVNLEDVIKIGYPYTMNTKISSNTDDMEINIIPARIIKYISEIANIPTSSAKTLHILDFTKLQEVILDFFKGGENMKDTQQN